MSGRFRQVLLYTYSITISSYAAPYKMTAGMKAHLLNKIVSLQLSSNQEASCLYDLYCITNYTLHLHTLNH